MRIRRTSWALLSLAFELSAQAPRPAIPYDVTDRFRPLPSDQQKIAGLFATRMRANSEGYLEHPDADALFKVGQGETSQIVGRYIAAAEAAYEYSRDPNLKAALDGIVNRLLSAPVPDSEGAKSDWVFGLMAYFAGTGNPRALESARRIADALAAQAKQGGTDAEVVPSPIESLTRVYRYTGELRYLEAAKSLADSWIAADRPPMKASTTNLAALSGVVEMYRTTGDEHYYQAAISGWDDFRSNHLTVTGGISLTPAQESERADVCASALWFDLSDRLLRVTGGTRFADALETTAYNQLFASQDARTGRSYSSVPLNGTREGTAPGCTPDMARAVASLPESTWGTYGNGIAMLFYMPGRSTVQLHRRRGVVQIYTEGNYPETGDLLVHVEPGHNIQFPLRLRVPSWCAKFTADVGGNHYSGRPGDFLLITREWRRGDTVKVSIDIGPRVIAGQGALSPYIALARGPQILAVSKTVNPGIQDLNAISLAPDATPTLEVKDTKIPGSWTGDQFYSLPALYRDQPRTIVAVTFADAIDYRVWIRRANTSAAVRP